MTLVSKEMMNGRVLVS